MPINQAVFLAGFAKLAAIYPPKATTPAGAAALVQGWWEVLERHDWIDADLFEEARLEVAATVSGYLIDPAEFVRVCENLDREKRGGEEREILALPPPAAAVADAINPADPYSCTAAERERWAAQDLLIRRWRLNIKHPWHMTDSDRGVEAWPNLNPAQRRAKETRIAAEKSGVPKLIREAAQSTRERIAGLQGARREALAQHALQAMSESQREALHSAYAVDLPPWNDRDEADLTRRHPHLRMIVGGSAKPPTKRTKGDRQ